MKNKILPFDNQNKNVIENDNRSENVLGCCSSFGLVSVTPYRVHYRVVEFQPRTAAIRSLDAVPLKFIVNYVLYPPLIPNQ